MVRTGEIRLLAGTDAASEGLNLQRLGTLINVDLPWNPTRLEQRKGRIQRIGQIQPEVRILNLRYRGSVEDRVHQLLASRQQTIHALFGQIPDTLEDVWVLVARHQEEDAQSRIDLVPTVHPFEMRYERRPENIDFESCARVLTADVQLEALLAGWL
jgi:superfamily II DNA/RNA helicase